MTSYGQRWIIALFHQAVSSWEGSRATHKAGLNLLWETKLKYTGEDIVDSKDIVDTWDTVYTLDTVDIVDTVDTVNIIDTVDIVNTVDGHRHSGDCRICRNGKLRTL